jgi:hypothetical protein
MGRQAKVQAVVMGKILGRPGSLAPGEVGRRTDDGHPKIRTDPDSDHVLSDKLARAIGHACRKRDIDPAKIDINVHPTKTEIKHQDEKSIYAVIRSAVKRS